MPSKPLRTANIPGTTVTATRRTEHDYQYVLYTVCEIPTLIPPAEESVRYTTRLLAEAEAKLAAEPVEWRAANVEIYRRRLAEEQAELAALQAAPAGAVRGFGVSWHKTRLAAEKALHAYCNRWGRRTGVTVGITPVNPL